MPPKLSLFNREYSAAVIKTEYTFYNRLII